MLLITQMSPVPLNISYIQRICFKFCFQKYVHYSKSIIFYTELHTSPPAIRNCNTKFHRYESQSQSQMCLITKAQEGN